MQSSFNNTNKKNNITNNFNIKLNYFNPGDKDSEQGLENMIRKLFKKIQNEKLENNFGTS